MRSWRESIVAQMAHDARLLAEEKWLVLRHTDETNSARSLEIYLRARLRLDIFLH